MATFLKSLLAFIWSALVGFWLFITYIDDGVSLQKGLTILIGLFLVLAGYIAYVLKTRMSGATAVGSETHRHIQTERDTDTERDTQTL